MDFFADARLVKQECARILADYDGDQETAHAAEDGLFHAFLEGFVQTVTVHRESLSATDFDKRLHAGVRSAKLLLKLQAKTDDLKWYA